MLLRQTRTLPIWSDLQRALGDFGVEVVGAPEIDNDVVSMKLPGGGFCALSFVPAPIPTDEVRKLAAVLAMAPPEPRASHHDSHVIVAANGPPGPAIGRRLLFTRLAAAAARALAEPDLVLYWGDAPNLVPVEALTRAAANASPRNVPIDVWVGLVGTSGPSGKPAILTSGLEALGHAELLIPLSATAPDDCVDFAWDMAEYLVESGATLQEGEAIGRSATERIPVQFVSLHGEPAKSVVFLAFSPG